MADLSGKILLNRYQVVELVGHGGMSTVYRVWDRQRLVHLAMKVLQEDLAEDQVFVRRFRREAQTLERLQHPHIVRFYGIEQDDLTVFMLMDFVDGTSLRAEIARLRGKPMEGKRILEVMKPVCSALFYAHNSGYVHCDVKPGNLLINSRGEVLVSDFGIARMAESATMTMVGVGTPAYMAPELVQGKEPTTHSDIYALGVVLFEMLSGGERPFNGDRAGMTGSLSERMRWEQVNHPPLSLRSFNAHLLPEVQAVVDRCLQKVPTLRFDSAVTLVQTLEIALNGKAAEDFAMLPFPLADEVKEVEIPPEKLKVDLGGGILMEFVYVPAGEFWMGSDPQVDQQAEGDEHPLHKVHLDGYYIGKFPVTVAQFEAFLNANRYPWSGMSPQERVRKAHHPVVCVNWKDVSAFCAWMSELNGKVIRLPGEAEWEKAARGADGRLYPWGNDVPDKTRSNFSRYVGSTTPVGKFSPLGDSPYGCADMLGNVWEWTADWYGKDYYGVSSLDNPTGPERGNTRVVRGGSWHNEMAEMRCANRYRCDPARRHLIYGFRCAVSL